LFREPLMGGDDHDRVVLDRHLDGVAYINADLIWDGGWQSKLQTVAPSGDSSRSTHV
jgi:hypothetical protein